MADIDEVFLTDIAFGSDLAPAANGDLQNAVGIANVKQALLHRLITQPGTLVHRPDYGVGVKDFQNSLNDLSNQRALALRIDEQFRRDVRVQDVVNVGIDADDLVPDSLTITIKVTLIGLGEQELQFKPFGSEGVE